MDSYYNDVNEWLTVGCDLDLVEDWMDQSHPVTIRELTDHGVTHVLDVRKEWTDEDTWVAAGLPRVNYCHAPITDSWNHKPSESWFRDVEAFVMRFLLESAPGDRIYVHCHMGVNRGPSAAMLALLTADKSMSAWDAFLAIREARSIAGLVYAEHVGTRHIVNVGLDKGSPDDRVLADMSDFRALLDAYWTPELNQSINRGIRYLHDTAKGTIVL